MDNQRRCIHFPPNRHLQIGHVYSIILNRNQKKKKEQRLTKSQIYDDIVFAEMAGKITKGVGEVGCGQALQDGINEYYQR